MRFTLLAILVSLSLLYSEVSFAQTRESLLKASFIEKFAKYTSWDEKSIAQLSFFKITVIGDEAFFHVLEKMYNNRTIKGKPVVVEYITDLRTIQPSQILFLAEKKSDKLDDILTQIAGEPVLLITEHPGAALSGSHINFYITKKQTLHFEINIKSVLRSHMEIDPLLLEIAKLIK